MIGPSDLYRVPRCASPSQSDELLRYARLEHDAQTVPWTLPAEIRGTPLLGGVRGWFASYLRLPRAPAHLAQPTPLRAGLAAVHFEEEPDRELRGLSAHADTSRSRDVLATSALILTVQPKQACADDVCTCEH